MSWRPAIAVLLLAAGCASPDMRRSGFEDMSAATQLMQRDDTANPAMLWVKDGEALWSSPANAALSPVIPAQAGIQRLSSAPACASCHGTLSAMRGVATRYPAWDDKLARPVNLGTRINLCRERNQQLPPWPPEHAQLLALEAAVAMQSRGMPIAPPADPRLEPFRRRGEALFAQRIGQLDLSCAQCHTERAGLKLAGTVIPQGQATGYPIYRLEWQGLGSLARRIRNCMTGVRAEPLAPGGVEMAELELHLAARAMGMPLETPAVRP